jgi:hypothetical protein
VSRPPYPLDQPRISTSIRELMADRGLPEPDGREWLLHVVLVYPIEAASLFAAVDPAIVQGGRVDLHLRLSLDQTPFGPVVELELIVANDPAMRATCISLLLDPSAESAQAWLQQLVEQRIVPIALHDSGDGAELLSLSALGITPSFREAIKRVLDETRDASQASAVQWHRAVAHHFR